MLGITLHALNKNLEKKATKECKSEFHSQILSSWIELHNKNPSSIEEILNEYIILNKHIQVENKPIPENFCGNNNNNLKIAQIVNQRRKIQNIRNTQHNLQIQISQQCNTTQ